MLSCLGLVASSSFMEAEGVLLLTGHLVPQVMTQTCGLLSPEDAEDTTTWGSLRPNPNICEAFGVMR